MSDCRESGRCSIPSGPCPGERAPRLCELVDPAHPDHRPGYHDSIADAVRQMADRPPPPLATQAGNLGAALFAWAVGGFSTASAEEQARRLGICRACPQWDGGRCRLCGCYLAAKIRLRTEHCPIARW